MTINIAQLPINFGDEAVTLFNRFYPLLLQNAWQDAADILGVELGFDLDNPFVQEVLHELAEQVVAIVETTREEIRVLVGRQAAEGWSIDQLADEIANLAETHAPRRAKMIARTETATAYTRGSLLAYEESGVVSQLEWLLGPESCEGCQEIAAQTPTVDLGDTFHGGAMVPAHPACTCAIAPVVV